MGGKGGGSRAVARSLSVPHKARPALLWQLATIFKSLVATVPAYRSDGGQVPQPLRETRAAIQLNPAKRRVIFCLAGMPRGQSSMNELSDEERDLLRYYAETERIIHGLVRVPFTSTCGEAQARYVVGARQYLLDPGTHRHRRTAGGPIRRSDAAACSAEAASSSIRPSCAECRAAAHGIPNEPRLADPRLADDQHQLAVALPRPFPIEVTLIDKSDHFTVPRLDGHLTPEP